MTSANHQSGQISSSVNMLRAVLRCPPRLALGRRGYADGGNGKFDLGSLLNRIDAATKARPKPAPKPRAPRPPRPQTVKAEGDGQGSARPRRPFQRQGPRPTGPRPARTDGESHKRPPREFQAREGQTDGRRPGPRPQGANAERRPFQRRPNTATKPDTTTAAAVASDIEYRFEADADQPSRGSGIGRRHTRHETGEPRASSGRRARAVAASGKKRRPRSRASGESSVEPSKRSGSKLWTDPLSTNFSPMEALELCLTQVGKTDNYVTPAMLTPDLLMQSYKPSAAVWNAPLQKTFNDAGPIPRTVQGHLPILPPSAPADDPIAQYVASNSWMNLEQKEFLTRVGQGKVPVSELKVYEP